jgi:radical SAM protein with 4Fe4S-binding SPASM domain
MMDGSLIVRHFLQEHYRILFNQRTGFFMRCEDEGYQEPLWSMHGPELLDISITNFCERGCEFCYRSSSISGKHMRLSEYENVITQAGEIGVLQVALGGGNPNQHPEFVTILELTRKYGIVPSYTTNGEGLTDTILAATSELCGAMAVSYYPSNGNDFYENLFARCSYYQIKTNLHLIISAGTVDAIELLLEYPPSWFEKVNACVFLNYKPVGRGVGHGDKEVLCYNRAEKFFRKVSESKKKIGFDSCSISGIARWLDVRHELVEACEAARFSAFISEDLKMYPCSFMVGSDTFGNLRKESMKEIWTENKAFIEQRKQYGGDTACMNCSMKSICQGGCRFLPEINWGCNNAI